MSASSVGDLLPRDIPIKVAAGDDFALPITVLGADGAGVDMSTDTTVVAEVLDGTTVVLTMTVTVTGTADEIVTLSLTDTQIDTLTLGQRYRWRLIVTKDSKDRTWFGGVFGVAPPGQPTRIGNMATGDVSLRLTDGIQVVIGTQGPAGANGTDVAPILTTDGDILTRAGGVPARITRAALAIDPAFALEYSPLNDTVVSVMAADFESFVGAQETRSNVSGTPCWAFANNQNAGVSAVVPIGPGGIPDHWVTADIVVLWAPADAGAGNVRWQPPAAVPGWSVGDTLPAASTAGTAFTSAAPGVAGQVTAVTLMSAITIPGEDYLTIPIRRNGANAADTYEGVVNVLGVRIVKVS